MVELVKYIAVNLVDNPEQVEVTEENGTIFLKVAPSDMGKIIGKQGRNAKALRTILKVASAKSEIKYNLEIVEEDK